MTLKSQELAAGNKDRLTNALSLKGELSLEVYTENQQAVDFYKTLGFEELSRRPIDDDGHPFEDAHLRLIG